jgi:hypothetical protein
MLPNHFQAAKLHVFSHLERLCGVHASVGMEDWWVASSPGAKIVPFRRLALAWL